MCGRGEGGERERRRGETVSVEERREGGINGEE